MRPVASTVASTVPVAGPPLSCTGVGVRVRGATLLHDVSLEVRPGELLAVLGPNGAGKSTLVGALAGDVPLAAGVVRLGGDDLATLSHQERARRRAVLLQQNPIAFPFTVRDVVAMGRAPWGDDEGVDAAMSRLRVDDLADRVVRSLSVGEQARVAMARVLAQDAPVMLLDEPTAVLDVGQQESLMRIVRGLVAEGRAVLAVLHDLNVAMAHADRVVVLRAGAVAAEGAPRAVLTDALLSDVYGQRVRVVDAPGHPSPVAVVVPQPGYASPSG